MKLFRSVPRWKTLIIAGAIAGAGALSFTAGDNFFEITKNLEIFNELYKELNIYYVEDTDPGDLMKTGIDAMLESLDPYTEYIAESDIEDYRFMTTGQYGGIGALIKRKGDGIVISEPYEGYPAMKAGIQAGDRILKVDDKGRGEGHGHRRGEQTVERPERHDREGGPEPQRRTARGASAHARRDQDPGCALQGHRR
jgi:C-terminal processing protease CtpA/Prc